MMKIERDEHMTRYEKAADGDDDLLMDLILAAHDMCVLFDRDRCEEGSPRLNLYKALDKMGWIAEEMDDT